MDTLISVIGAQGFPGLGYFPFLADYAYGIDECSQLARNPDPFRPYKRPENNADSYINLAAGMLDISFLPPTGSKISR